MPLEFLNKWYIFQKKDSDEHFHVKIYQQDDGKFFSESKIRYNNKDYSYTSEVFRGKRDFFESIEFKIDEMQQISDDLEVTNPEFKINDREVIAYKIKVKFNKTKLSPISSILVLHKGIKHWITYPFDTIGDLVCNN